MSLTALPAAAQDSVGRIVASVNDEAITDFDLDARSRMLARAATAPLDQQSRTQIARQALRELIDDQLKSQEAKRLGIKVNDKEVAASIGTIERNNRLPPGGVFKELTQKNVPVGTLIDQIKSTILWRKILRQRVLPQVRVASAEVDRALSRIREAGGTSIIRAAEIFLPYDASIGWDSLNARAIEIAGQAKDSATFAQLAGQNSRASTAAVSGDLGEIQPGQLAPMLEQALNTLSPGQTSPPVRTDRGIHLLHLVSKRSVEAGATEQAVVTLARVFLRLATGDDPAISGLRLSTTVAGVDGCDAFERAGKTINLEQPPRVVDARIGDLPEELREPVNALKPGETTPPIVVGNGIAVLMLCRRAEVGGNLPSAQRIADAIQRQRTERRAERYLRDLRRLAFIDIRG
jgi:peptidyl-prolyl cis-trans isomerase SurA